VCFTGKDKEIDCTAHYLQGNENLEKRIFFGAVQVGRICEFAKSIGAIGAILRSFSWPGGSQ
jgi:hypothetical protein